MGLKNKIKNIIPDKIYLKLVYKKRLGKKLNLKDPKTFNEKLQWLKLYDRNPKYTALVDKYEVKKYIEKQIGKQYVIPTLGVYDKFDEIDFDKLPNQFVIKCTHDSGGLVICKDKSKLNIEESRDKIENCLNTNYYYQGREWPYKNVKPRIIIEKYMEDNKGCLFDYKFMCFNGEAKLSFVCTDRDKKDLKVTFFDKEWNKMPFERHYKSSNEKIDRPKQYELMIQLAEKLSKDIPFVRVDFYEVDNQIYFGELTFYPGCGFEEFEPEEWDEKLGEFIKI
ncbi:MAG: glycosyl transferase [Clostridia bacterium]|nr:glycosyl transferase [Clostridia bacterium]